MSKSKALQRTSGTADSSNSSYAFISYAHKDSALVLPIIEKLSAQGFGVWYDAGIEAGTEWPEYVAKHLENAACVIAFLSSASVDSFNCRQEINYAIDMKKPLLSVYLEKLELTGGMRMRLGLSQAMFYHRHKTFDSFLSELARSEILAPCLQRKNGAAPPFEGNAETPLHIRPMTENPSPLNQDDGDFLIQNGVLLEYRGKGGEVTVPDGVTAIGHAAFIRTDVTDVTIPHSVKEIGQAAFQSCSLLTAITIPGSVKSLGTAIFLGCEKLSRVVLEEGLPFIGNNMFALCGSLSAITVPAGVHSIENFAFMGCAKLESVTLTSGLKYIAADSFAECRSLKTVAIPETVTEIGPRAFQGCERLKKAYISKKTKYGKLFGRAFPKNTWVIKN